jgi:hypothetical protein
MDLAGLDGQVDVVVGDKIAEALRDAAEFESQGNLPLRERPGRERNRPPWRRSHHGGRFRVIRYIG